MSTQTIWGAAQNKTVVRRGMIFYSTASHGGYHLSATLNRQVHESWRNPEGWYEEDCAWGIVAVTFPEDFTEAQISAAHATLKSYFPHDYEKAMGVTVALEESNTLREEKFLADNKNNYIVLSAWGDWHESVPKGYVGVFAGRGGRLPNGRYPVDCQYFFVPEEEYSAPRTDGAFVIDEARHELWSPSPKEQTKQVA